MTEISFHFNVQDKLLHTCRLLRKAYGSGAQVAVTAEPQVLSDLDRMLWNFSATEFVPHSRSDAASGLLKEMSVLLIDSTADCPHHGVLINLGLGIPDEFERFKRFIEVVTQSVDERAAARGRWKHYSARGHSIQTHDLSESGEG